MNGEGGAVFKSYTVKNGLPSDILLSVEVGWRRKLVDKYGKRIE